MVNTKLIQWYFHRLLSHFCFVLGIFSYLSFACIFCILFWGVFLLFVACLLKRKRWMWGRSRRSWGRGNHNQSILYKNFSIKDKKKKTPGDSSLCEGDKEQPVQHHKQHHGHHDHHRPDSQTKSQGFRITLKTT